MGTILASSTISKASIVLQDPTNVRWSSSELLGWYNDGLRAICSAYPELSTTTANITLVAGTKQALPSAAVSLITIVRNMGTGGATPGAAVRKVSHEALDMLVPQWHAMTPVTDIKHYTYDPRVLDTFYVYPPSVSGNQLEAQYVVVPSDIALGTAIPLDDAYANVVLDYILYRAYSKDIEQPGSAERAAASYALFKEGLGARKMADTEESPANARQE